MGGYWDYCISAARDVLKLELPGHAAFALWERCTIEGGWRHLHPRFCMVCDFPVRITEKRATTITWGTGRNTYVWRDGWSV